MHNFTVYPKGIFSKRVTYYKNEILKHPKHLFKFYNNTENSLNAMLENYIYFSNPRHFNDPFDCLTNREKYILKGGNSIKLHRDNIGICCFSLNNDNPLLWGHYTNSYTGFCVKYSDSDFLQNNNIQISRHISYLKNYLPANDNLQKAIEEIQEFDLLETQKENIKKVLMMDFEYTWKHYDWKYEKEYRAISVNSDSFNRKLKINPNILTEVYIGHRMKSIDSNYYNLLLHILHNNYPNVKIFEVKPHPLIVKLEFEQIRY